MSHIREASKVTINTSYFHPAHQHYTDEAHIYNAEKGHLSCGRKEGLSKRSET